MDEDRGVKRKLVVRSLYEKYKAIKAVESGTSRLEVSRLYDVKHNTLSDWIKGAEKIKNDYERGSYSTQTKRRKTAKFEDVEIALAKWFTEKNTATMHKSIDRNMLIEKAHFFARELGVENFYATNGWFSRFTMRHAITYKRVSGEAKLVDMPKVEDIKTRLKEIIADFSTVNIYNADETALFWKCTPDKKNCKQGVKCVRGKQPKNRVSILVASNWTGSDKLPILVIGKWRNPRCFKNIKELPVQYQSNDCALMTSEIFSQWVEKIDSQMHDAGRRICMIVDNCSAHAHVAELRSVKLVFLPPNLTRIVQPMEQGIIQNLKFQYRKRLAHKKLAELDTGSIYNETLLGALKNLRHAWSLVTRDTIRDCFRRAFSTDADENDFKGFSVKDVQCDDDDDELFELLGVDKTSFIIQSVKIDAQAQCTTSMTDAEIMAAVTNKNALTDNVGEESCDTDDENHEDETPIVSTSDATKAFETIHNFILQSSSCDDSENVYNSLSTIGKFIAKQQLKRIKRIKLNFLNKK